MQTQLNGVTVAILLTDGFEQVELTGPREALRKAGASTLIISTKPGKVQGVNHDTKADTFDVDHTFDEVRPEQFDAVLLPGGVMNGDQMRIIPQAQAFVQTLDAAHKPIAVICHGGWLLVSSGLVDGRTMTSWPTLEDDIRNAGGKWVDQEVVVDQNWVSSRKPDDIPAFNEKMLELIANRSQLQGAGAGLGNTASGIDGRA